MPWSQESFRLGRRYWVAFAILTATIGSLLAATNAHTRQLLINTIVFAGSVASVSLLGGFTVAVFIHRSHHFARQLVIGMIMWLLFAPAYLQVAGWLAGFGQQGIVTRWMFPNELAAILAGWPGAIWMQSIIGLPWATLIVCLGMSSIPAELKDHNVLDGKAQAVLWQIELRFLRPSLIGAWTWVFVTAASDISVTDVFQIPTFAEEVYVGFALGDDLISGPVRNLPSMIMVGGLSLAAIVACYSIERHLHHGIHPLRFGRREQQSCTPMVSALTIVIITLAVAVPLLSLIIQSGLTVNASQSPPIRTWSLIKALQIVLTSPWRYREELAWSVVVGQAVAISTVLLAMIVTWRGRRNPVVNLLGWTVTVLGLATPGPIVALAVTRIVNQPTIPALIYLYDETIFAPWICLAFRMFPFAFLTFQWLVERLNPYLIDSVVIETKRPSRQIAYTLMRQLRIPLVGLWILIFALSMADLSTTILAVPPGVNTISIRIFNLVHYGVTDQLAGLCLATASLFSVLAQLGYRFIPLEADKRLT